MGLISGIQATKALQDLKGGKAVKLSLAQITDLLVNLQDAKRNLSPEEFEGVYTRYRIAQQDKQKTVFKNITAYYRACVPLIKYFDKAAPFELYSGNYSPDFKILVEAIRSGELDDIPENIPMLPL